MIAGHEHLRALLIPSGFLVLTNVVRCFPGEACTDISTGVKAVSTEFHF